ncbi:MAG TPA: phosphotransferase family protein [Burkholderiaceae bacterium]|nr:phosphotransferase family protein [Burkholderiaceae bacterium]
MKTFDSIHLEKWLQKHVPSFQGPLKIESFAGGQSNPTFKLITPSQCYVMRSKPGPASKLLPSAHAIEREFRILQALHGSTVPVAQPYALCEDESIIGRAFYVMEFLNGRVLWDQGLPGLPQTERRAIYLEMNRVMAALHTLDPASMGLADFGKPGNYFERQISRWTKQYQSSITHPIEAMDALIDWLPRHIPASARDEDLISIVHGDYRMDNLMFAVDQPKAMAVLDWELSTIGHPLADFSYHCMSWHIEPGAFRGILGLDLPALGIPQEDEYIQRYCDATGFVTPHTLQADWNFYLAYNMFRIAAILQGIAKRVEAGTASSAQALKSAAGARPLAQKAWQYAQRFGA